MVLHILWMEKLKCWVVRGRRVFIAKVIYKTS